jgi:predicted dithiol-disulfide oxidoreductase (DUF899 family)
MVEVDPSITLIGSHGPVTLLDVFESRRQLIAYYFMWHTGRPAAAQRERCTRVTTAVPGNDHSHVALYFLYGFYSGVSRSRLRSLVLSVVGDESFGACTA